MTLWGRFQMDFEIEAKFRVSDLSGLARDLVSHGWTESRPTPSVEEDLYFQGIDRDFRQTGEALRVRVHNGLPRFTYKGGAKLSEGGVKVRREIELEMPRAKASEAFCFLEALGFQRVALVRKTRRTFANGEQWPGIILTLDDVESLGFFAEIEFLSNGSEPEVALAVKRVAEIALQLGFGEKENRSYLRMLMEKA